MHYDPSQLPVLGLWINFHGWSGCGSAPYFNLGIEPATAAFDSLCDAVQAGKQRILGPGASDRWRLRLCIH